MSKNQTLGRLLLVSWMLVFGACNKGNDVKKPLESVKSVEVVSNLKMSAPAVIPPTAAVLEPVVTSKLASPTLHKHLSHVKRSHHVASIYPSKKKHQHKKNGHLVRRGKKKLHKYAHQKQGRHVIAKKHKNHKKHSLNA